MASDFGKRGGPCPAGDLCSHEERCAAIRDTIPGFCILRGKPTAGYYKPPCTPRCSDMHALDCPNYSGPLSATGWLSPQDHSEVARRGMW